MVRYRMTNAQVAMWDEIGPAARNMLRMFHRFYLQSYGDRQTARFLTGIALTAASFGYGQGRRDGIALCLSR